MVETDEAIGCLYCRFSVPFGGAHGAAISNDSSLERNDAIFRNGKEEPIATFWDDKVAEGMACKMITMMTVGVQ